MNVSFDYPWAHGGPLGRALLKGENEDFVVTEIFNGPINDEGEHLYLWVKSNGDNTQWLAKAIADALTIDVVDIGFSGLKDRNAVTFQWFSIYDPKRMFAARITEVFNNIGTSELLETRRGIQKLRRGMHSGNRFNIRLVFEQPLSLQCINELEQRLHKIREQGVPNYFGQQRFGHGGNNLKSFDAYVQLAKIKSRKRLRKPKGIVISAARSHIFNVVLATKVHSCSWNELLAGDPQLDGLPSSPLWGRGRLTSSEDAKLIEQGVADQFADWAGALECLGLQQERRANICRPSALSWLFGFQDLCLNFELPPGEYATSVLREIVDCYEPEREFVREKD